jgi:hypothetical protein
MHKKDSGLVHIDANSPASVFINGGEITDRDVYDAIDLAVGELKRTKDLQIVDNALSSLLSIQTISIFGISKMMFEVKKWWDENDWDEETGDTFDDRFYSSHGLNSVIIERYISVWEYRPQMPKKIHARPLKDQIAIAQTLSEGYDISKDRWKELEQADSNAKVLKILREIKGKPPRKSSLTVYLNRDGNLTAYDSEGNQHFIGFLQVKDEKSDPIVKKVIERIVKNTGTIRR